MKKKMPPIVYLRFWDHSQSPSPSIGPIICEIFGIIKKEDDLAYHVITWISNADLHDPNSDGYCVLKSAVTHYVELGEVKKKRKPAKGAKREAKTSNSRAKRSKRLNSKSPFKGRGFVKYVRCR